MNDLSFKTWITIVGPLAILQIAIASPLIGIWTWLYKKSERSDERWLDTQGKIYAIMSKMNMTYIDPNAPKPPENPNTQTLP